MNISRGGARRRLKEVGEGVLGVFEGMGGKRGREGANSIELEFVSYCAWSVFIVVGLFNPNPITTRYYNRIPSVIC